MWAIAHVGQHACIRENYFISRVFLCETELVGLKVSQSH